MLKSCLMPVTENELSYLIRGAIFRVYNTLGPGLLESVYELALFYELSLVNLTVEKQVALPVHYGEIIIDGGYRIDILVNNLIIIEIKSVEALTSLHHKQLLTYLKLAQKKLGILINFNSNNIADSIFRKVNSL
jgi:GxxExxY protein